jgi:hypothetical protein
MPPIDLVTVDSVRATAQEVAELPSINRGRSGSVRPVEVVRRVRSAGSSSTANGRVIRARVPATSVVRVTYRPRLREHATTFGVPCSATRQ